MFVGVAGLWLVLWSVAAWDGQVLTGDEVILLSVSESLVEQGRLGAPIFAGVYGAGEHYFMSPPLEHVMHWPLMRAFGVAVWNGRLVSLVAGLWIVVGSSVLVYRAAGGLAAALVSLLLVSWRTGLVGTGWGIPLVSLSRSIRYDVLVVGWVVAGLLALEWWLRTGRRGAAAVLGLSSAAALLTHWVGLVLPAAAVASWLLTRGRERPAARSAVAAAAWMVAGLTPWLVHALLYVPDVIGQWTLVHGWRAEAAIGAVGSVVGNLVREPLRYRGVLEAGGPGAAALALAVLAAVRLNVWVPSRNRGVVAVVQGVLIGSLAILAPFEPTKSPVYGLVLVVPLTMAAAVAASALIRGGNRAVRLWIALPIVVLTVEGVIATVRDVRATRSSTPYEEVAATLAQAMPDGAATGPQRWWWSLRDKGYVPMATLSLRWEAARRHTPDTTFVDVWRAAGIRHVVWSDEQEADQARWPPAVREFLERVRTCGASLLRITDRTYGALEVIGVPTSCAAPADD